MDLNEKVEKLAKNTVKQENLVKGPDLDDNQKRWLVIGICLHTVVSPTLRKYVSSAMDTLYNTLKQVNNIHQQSFPNILKKFPPGHTVLNYDSVNNNSTIPSDRRKRNPSCLDYKIQNSVDLSKLFLAQNMANYTGFDDTCDLSALLGTLAKSDMSRLGKAADQIRKDVRNPWAHCNFDQWDMPMYLSSFQQIRQLINEIKLPPPMLQNILSTLTEWETKGFTFLNGRSLELDLLTEMNERTSTLAKYILLNKSANERSFSRVGESLNGIISELKRALKRAESYIDYIREETEKLRLDDIATKKKITDIKCEMENIQCDIKNMKCYFSHQRPNGKPLFYPPDRLDCFVGRDDILVVLQNSLKEKQIQVICGLGGAGKTAVAIEFAWLFQESYPGGVFWLSAESDEAIEDTISSLAIDVNTSGNTTKETLKKTLSWLASLTRGWLLVIDNADFEHISTYMKELLFGAWKRNSKGALLITTRRELIEVEESFKIEIENCHELKCLSDEESILFITKRSGRDTGSEDKEHILELVQELGGLPLALEQAAAQIKRIDCTFTDYLIRFKKTQLDLFKKPLIPFSESERQRYAVTTTWELNLEKICLEAEREGLRETPTLLMKISAFLHADDIPLSIFNGGEPAVLCDYDILSDPIDIKRSVEILTRFSLFQRGRNEGLSVHRLVQEVIRSKMKCDERLMVVSNAVRMLNKALLSTSSPQNVIKAWKVSREIDRGSLYIWSKLAVHSSVLKLHVSAYSKTDDEAFCSLEMAKVLHTSAIFNSFQNRQDIALTDQAKMFSTIAALHIEEHAITDLIELKIPLLMQDRQCIRNSIALVLKTEEIVSKLDPSGKPLSIDVLQNMGNNAVRERRYEDAIQYYTEALRACRKEECDPRLYSNRSLVYLKTKRFYQALNDANCCIDIDPFNVEGHVRKAFAIAELIENGNINAEMEGSGLSSVSIAAVLDKETLVERKMKIYFPIVCYKIVEPSSVSLGHFIMDMSGARPFTTYVLKKGNYYFTTPVKSYKSCQVVGMEDGVILTIGTMFLIEAPIADEFDFHFQMEEKVTIHFENVSFVSDGKIDVGLNGIATFYRCQFANGKQVDNNSNFTQFDKKSTLTFPKLTLNRPVFSSVSGSRGSQISLHSCTFNNCPGFSIFVEGQSSLLDINNCEITKSNCSGVVVQNGVTMKMINSKISENGLYGMEIGTDCDVTMHGNTVDGNSMDGAFFGIVQNVRNIEDKKIKASIQDNSFCHNGLSGLILSTGSYEIKDNKMNNNWARGILVLNHSSSSIQNNEISANRCGGIRVGINSASVYIVGNTIKDHNGPDIDIEDSELTCTKVINKHNIFDRFKKSFTAPREHLNYCCSCKRCYKNLKKCGICKITTYCSKECQTDHWPEHKKICRVLGQSCNIDLELGKAEVLHGTSVSKKNLQRLFSKSYRTEVHVESDHNYEPYNNQKLLTLYTQTKTLYMRLKNPELYNLCSECGTLQEDKIIMKTLLCYASFKNDFKVLSILTTEFPGKRDINSS